MVGRRIEGNIAPGSSAMSIAMLLGGSGDIKDLVLICFSQFWAFDNVRLYVDIGVWIPDMDSKL